MDEKKKAMSLKEAMSQTAGKNPSSGELSDDDLEGVAGGVVLSHVFIAQCPLCGWQSQPFTGGDEAETQSDVSKILADHRAHSPNCTAGESEISVYLFT